MELKKFDEGHMATPLTLRLSYFSKTPRGVGTYAFEIGAQPQGGFEVRSEECKFEGFFGRSAFYRVEKGVVLDSSLTAPPAASSDRLYLVNVSGLPEFRNVYQNLANMRFYNLNPESIRQLQSPDSGDLLLRDGSNIASMIRKFSQHPEIKTRSEEYLSKVVLGVEGVEFRNIGSKETLEFRQQVQGARDPWKFPAENMSDGTLRALGILVALFQAKISTQFSKSLVGIEEPEMALHPAAAGVLRDALNDAADNAQIIVTSHSPDLLDDYSVSDKCILAVSSERGTTAIAPIEEAGRQVIRDKLYTAGELLRLGQLIPDEDYSNKIDAEEKSED